MLGPPAPGRGGPFSLSTDGALEGLVEAAGLGPERTIDKWDGHDVVASPEWFGDGWKAYREVLFRRELAELIVAANPRRAGAREVNWA